MPGGMLSFLIFFPIIAGLFIGIASSNNFIKKNIKILALTFTFIEMALSILLYFNYDKDNGGFQFIDYFDSWIPFESFRAQYLVGVDGLSAPLVLLTGILGFCAVIASLKINFREREYFMWLLILQGVVRVCGCMQASLLHIPIFLCISCTFSTPFAYIATPTFFLSLNENFLCNK